MPGKIHGNPGIFSHLQGYPDQKWGFNHEVVTTIWRPYWALIPGAAKCWWYHLQKNRPMVLLWNYGQGRASPIGLCRIWSKTRFVQNMRPLPWHQDGTWPSWARPTPFQESIKWRTVRCFSCAFMVVSLLFPCRHNLPPSQRLPHGISKGHLNA